MSTQVTIDILHFSTRCPLFVFFGMFVLLSSLTYLSKGYKTDEKLINILLLLNLRNKTWKR